MTNNNDDIRRREVISQEQRNIFLNWRVDAEMFDTSPHQPQSQSWLTQTSCADLQAFLRRVGARG